MIELLTTNLGGDKKLYPNSGPGPITLQFGDEDLGYFGTLTSEEMFTTPELATHLGIARGSSYVNNPTWVKCFVNGRILFTPTQRLMAGVSWDDIYKAGALYGDNTDGKYPTNPPVKQDTVITKGVYAFKVRVWGKDSTEPTPYASSSYPPTTAFEFLRFITKFFDGTHSSFNGSWRLFSLAGQTTAILQSVTGAPATQHVTFYYASTAAQGMLLLYTKENAATAWWPVLEPVDFSSQLLPIKAVNSNPLDNDALSRVAITSLVTEQVEPGELLKAISVNGLSYDTVAPKPVAITELEVTQDPDWPKQISRDSIRQSVFVTNIAITSLTYEP